MTTTPAAMSDYEGIKAALDDYFDGLRLADRERLERAFAVDHAHMKAYLKNAQGERIESSRPMREVIDEWVARDPNPSLTGAITSINIYSDVGAQATFDFDGRYTDAFQLAKIDGQWRIMTKFYVDQ